MSYYAHISISEIKNSLATGEKLLHLEETVKIQKVVLEMSKLPSLNNQ